MKTEQVKRTSCLCLFIGIFWMICCPGPSFGQGQVQWLDEFTAKFLKGSDTCSYRFTSVGEDECDLLVEEITTNKKGETDIKGWQFFLSDLNSSALNFKTLGEFATVYLEMNQGQKLIRVYKNGVWDGYANRFALQLSKIHQTHPFIDVLTKKSESCRQKEWNWNSGEETTNWLSMNLGKSTSGEVVWQQSFRKGEQNHLASVEMTVTGPKGDTQNLSYDFNIKDIDPEKIELNYDGNSFKIELSTFKNEPFIRLKKETGEIGYLKSFQLFSESFEQARSLFNGLVFLVKHTDGPVRKSWNNYAEALGYVKNNIREVDFGPWSVNQSFDFDPSESGMVHLNFQKSDQRKTETPKEQSFYLSDIQPQVNIEASSKSIVLNLSVKDKAKYIKEVYQNNPLPFIGVAEIYENDLEKARELANALTFAIKRSELGLEKFDQVNGAIDWMQNNVNDVNIDLDTIVQKLTIDSGMENKMVLSSSRTKAGGVEVTQIFEIYPEDLKTDACVIEVSSNQLLVVLSTGKPKFISCKTDSLDQSFVSEAEVYFDDVKRAKNFLTAITFLAAHSDFSKRSYTDKEAAIHSIEQILSETVKNGQLIDQRLEFVDNSRCNAKITRVELGKKGERIETVYEFSFFDIDSKLSGISSGSKTLSVELYGRERARLIQVFVNGVSKNYINHIEIETDNAVTAKNLLAAFRSLSGFCK